MVAAENDMEQTIRGHAKHAINQGMQWPGFEPVPEGTSEVPARVLQPSCESRARKSWRTTI